jgi:transposase
MPRSYSQDLRERAVALVAAGHSRRSVAGLLGLAESTVINWAKRQDVTGSCAAKRMGGHRRALLPREPDRLLARVSAVPDPTVRALRTELAERGTDVCVDTVWRFLMAEGLTFKKKPVRSRAGAA